MGIVDFGDFSFVSDVLWEDDLFVFRPPILSFFLFFWGGGGGTLDNFTLHLDL